MAVLRPMPSGLGWRYRALEHLIAGAAATVAVLAALGPALGAAPGVFVAAVVAAALMAAGGVIVLERLRRRASVRVRHGLNAALGLAVIALVVKAPPQGALRGLAELLARERGTQLRVVAHQVYAAYRRMDLAGQKQILGRAEVYEPSIREAAEAFGLDAELLLGIASTESSFHPRPSTDGGQGLFQITRVPKVAEQRAREILKVDRLDPLNQKHNAFVAAATLEDYARRMDGDLLLTLLAYNIGPHNGGLEFVMDRYGARNFAQVQPYLQALPRDYPIRVLSHALTFRIWRHFRDLPPFEEGEWAARIRELGVPGLHGGGPLFAAVAP